MEEIRNHPQEFTGMTMDIKTEIISQVQKDMMTIMKDLLRKPRVDRDKKIIENIMEIMNLQHKKFNL